MSLSGNPTLYVRLGSRFCIEATNIVDAHNKLCESTGHQNMIIPKKFVDELKAKGEKPTYVTHVPCLAEIHATDGVNKPHAWFGDADITKRVQDIQLSLVDGSSIREGGRLNQGSSSYSFSARKATGGKTQDASHFVGKSLGNVNVNDLPKDKNGNPFKNDQAALGTRKGGIPATSLKSIRPQWKAAYMKT